MTPRITKPLLAPMANVAESQAQVCLMLRPGFDANRHRCEFAAASDIQLDTSHCHRWLAATDR